jgi:hypothetical protein
MAITQETDALRAVEHALSLLIWQNGGKQGKQPEPRPYPEGTAAERAKQNRVVEQARAFRARHKKE